MLITTKIESLGQDPGLSVSLEVLLVALGPPKYLSVYEDREEAQASRLQDIFARSPRLTFEFTKVNSWCRSVQLVRRLNVFQLKVFCL